MYYLCLYLAVEKLLITSLKVAFYTHLIVDKFLVGNCGELKLFLYFYR